MPRRNSRASSHRRPQRPTQAISIWKKALGALVMTLVMMLLTYCVGLTDLGQRLRVFAYDYMQNRLTLSTGAPPISVVVVDTSDIPVLERPRGTTAPDWQVRHTDYEKLRKRIQDVAARMPKAIGVDFDLSEVADLSGFGPTELDSFKSYCLKLKSSGIPVYLGVNRTAREKPSSWLSGDKYISLAAGIMAPEPERVEWMLLWIKEANYTPLKSMSKALADDYGAREPEIRPWLRWAVEVTQEKRHEPPPVGLTARGFIVNYGALKRLKEETVTAGSGYTERLDSVRNRIVLLGDVKTGDSNDVFTAPNQPDVPGVYLHACGADTLVRAPLYDLTWPGRVALDLAFAVLFFAAITVAQLRLARKRDTETDIQSLHSSMTLVVIALAFAAGVLFVNKTHIMWDDFPLVIVGLLANRPVEEVVHVVARFMESIIRPRRRGK